MSARHTFAPKPANWEQLVAAWNDPIAFARESQIYDAQVARAHVHEALDTTQPRRTPGDDNGR